MQSPTHKQRADRVATRLRFAFSALGATNYREAAELCGAPETSVQNWMIGNALIPILPALALQAKGISLDWLYCGPPAPKVDGFRQGRPVGWRKPKAEGDAA